MAIHLKRRIARELTDEIDRKVRPTVEAIIADVGRAATRRCANFGEVRQMVAEGAFACRTGEIRRWS